MSLVKEADCYRTLNTHCDNCPYTNPGAVVRQIGTDSQGSPFVSFVNMVCRPDTRQPKATVIFSRSIDSGLADMLLEQAQCSMIRR